MADMLPGDSVIASEAKQSIVQQKERMDCLASLAMTKRASLWMMVSAFMAPPPPGRYFIGQMASATAACGGKIVTNLPPTYCSKTGSASLF